MSDGTLRIGDTERDATVDQLNQHFAAGRLTALEREERTTRALTARTARDLAALLADLPRLDGDSPPRRRRLPGWALPFPLPLLILPLLLGIFVFHAFPVFLVIGLWLLLARRRMWGCRPSARRWSPQW